jgi:hypothetical protein
MDVGVDGLSCSQQKLRKFQELWLQYSSLQLEAVAFSCGYDIIEVYVLPSDVFSTDCSIISILLAARISKCSW